MQGSPRATTAEGPVWGKPHTYVPPTDCLHGCGDGADRPEPPSQHPAGMRGLPRATTVEGLVWGKPHAHAPPRDCLRGCGDGADRPEPPSQHPAGMRGLPRATTVEVRCGASPTPTCRRRIACAVAATVPSCRNRPRNIPHGCGTRPARPPRKAGVGQAPHLRSANGLPARLRRRCRPAGIVLAISRGDAGLAPHDHRGNPVWGKPHTYVPPTDCLRGCGDDAELPEPPSQHPAGRRDSPRATTVQGPVWGKPHPHAPPSDCLRGCGDDADRTERPSQYRL